MATPAQKDLPNEVWTEILADKQLSYYDLKRVASVSKRFKAFCQVRLIPRASRALTESPSLQLPMFDEILFRGTPQAKLASGTEVKLHPVLEEAGDLIGEKIEHLVLYPEDYTGVPWKICELTCASEFATWPTLKSIVLGDYRNGNVSSCFGAGGTVENASGVTVMDLLKGIASGWAKKDLFENYWYLGNGTTHMSHLEALTVDRVWAGWDEAKVSKEGKVTLRPHFFDS